MRSRLGAYEVGLSCLLLRFAEEAEIDQVLMDCLLREVSATNARCLSTLRQEMCGLSPEATEIWEILLSGLRSVDSPDALFDLFRSLESMICRELVSTSLMHSSGAFGQLARRLILSFKQASFEAVVKLYDSVQSFLTEEMDIENQPERNPKNENEMNDENDERDEHENMGVEDVKSPATSRSRPRLSPMSPMQQVPLSVGRLPYVSIEATVQNLKMNRSHTAFLQYVSSSQHRFVDAADSCLRSFYDGRQVSERTESLPVVQNAILTLANLHLEMRHVDDALQALEDSIRAAQETSDGSCLCACLYLLSFILLQSGSPIMASSMMQRCLERSEALGLPLLQCLCCMGIARSLTLQPERRLTSNGELGSGHGGHGGHGHGQLATGGSIAPGPGPTGPGPGPAGSFGFGASRMWGSNGNRGFGLLAALSHGPGAGREAFAHGTMASLLSTQGALQETRPKVLLCNAGISEVFGLHSLTKSSCQILLNTYHDSLTAEEHALALCQQLSPDDSTIEVLKKLKQELPHAGHIWVCAIMPKLCSEMLNRNAAAVDLGALVFQTSGALRAVPQSFAADAMLRWRIATNETRLHQGQLLAAYQSAREAIESPEGQTGQTAFKSSVDLCKHLLSCSAIHLKAQNPVGAMASCMRCISVAENANLLDVKAEALLMMARLKLEMQDFLGALQLAEEMQLASAKLRGELFLMQAETLLELLAREAKTETNTETMPSMIKKLLESIVERLQLAVKNFQVAKVSQDPYGHCHYLLARCYHQMGDLSQRDHHAREFRLTRQPRQPSQRLLSSLYPIP